ncbi:MAG: hypothetical protein GYA16_15630 [Spirochaetes bacterium]|nr:hypothetical protein [Spirochaetota bacterium]
MEQKQYYAYHRAGYDLLYALKNGQLASSYEEAMANLMADYRDMNPSLGYIPDTEIFIYKIKIVGTNVTVNDGDYEPDDAEMEFIINS